MNDNHLGRLFNFGVCFCIRNLIEIVSKPTEAISNFEAVKESKIKGKTIALIAITINNKWSNAVNEF
jgi:hypothetical protein